MEYLGFGDMTCKGCLPYFIGKVTKIYPKVNKFIKLYGPRPF